MVIIYIYISTSNWTCRKTHFFPVSHRYEWNIHGTLTLVTPKRSDSTRRVFQGGTVLSPADCTDVPRAFRATLAGAPGGSVFSENHHGESGKNADLP
jgi:hypothetical protein